jgi:hypothetical protein
VDHCNGASAYVLRAVISAERQEIIVNVERFVKLMTGHFDNKEQFTEMKEDGKIFPYAQHVNTVCNDKIKNLKSLHQLYIRKRMVSGKGANLPRLWHSGCGRSFQTLVWRYPKVWKSMEREHLDMMCRLDIKG